jgi:hypothetical protein
MIECYTGLLGGGKSYKAINRSAKYLASGGTLTTNIEILFEPMKAYIEKEFQYAIVPQQIVQLENSYEAIRQFHLKAPRGSIDAPSLAIIDEAGIFLNTRDSGKTRDLADWLRLSRKDCTDCIFIAQEFRDIDVAIRRLCLYIYVMKDLATVAMPGMKMRWASRFTEQAFYSVSGKPVSGTMKVIKKNPVIFTLYRTEQMFREFPRLSAAARLGAKIEVRKKRRNMAKWIAVIFIVAIFWFGGKGYAQVRRMMHPKEEAPRQVEKVSAPKATPVPDDGFRKEVWESVRATDGATYLLTAKGKYFAGQRSERGLCERVTIDGCADVIAPDGRKFRVVSFSESAPTMAQAKR